MESRLAPQPCDLLYSVGGVVVVPYLVWANHGRADGGRHRLQGNMASEKTVRSQLASGSWPRVLLDRERDK